MHTAGTDELGNWSTPWQMLDFNVADVVTIYAAYSVGSAGQKYLFYSDFHHRLRLSNIEEEW